MESLTNRLICLFLAAKALTMVAKCKQKRVVSTLKSLFSDGLSLPIEDRQNFEALVEEYLVTTLVAKINR